MICFGDLNLEILLILGILIFIYISSIFISSLNFMLNFIFYLSIKKVL